MMLRRCGAGERYNRGNQCEAGALCLPHTPGVSGAELHTWRQHSHCSHQEAAGRRHAGKCELGTLSPENYLCTATVAAANIFYYCISSSFLST